MIELQRVSVAYADGGRPAVREANLSIPAGDFVALVGPSGSGKTSLLKTINRLIEPSGGTIRVEDRDVADFAAHELRRRIGYVFQGIGLFPPLRGQTAVLGAQVAVAVDHALGMTNEQQAQLVDTAPR